MVLYIYVIPAFLFFILGYNQQKIWSGFILPNVILAIMMFALNSGGDSTMVIMGYSFFMVNVVVCMYAIPVYFIARWFGKKAGKTGIEYEDE